SRNPRLNPIYQKSYDRKIAIFDLHGHVRVEVLKTVALDNKVSKNKFKLQEKLGVRNGLTRSQATFLKKNILYNEMDILYKRRKASTESDQTISDIDESDQEHTTTTTT